MTLPYNRRHVSNLANAVRDHTAAEVNLATAVTTSVVLILCWAGFSRWPQLSSELSGVLTLCWAGFSRGPQLSSEPSGVCLIPPAVLLVLGWLATFLLLRVAQRAVPRKHREGRRWLIRLASAGEILLPFAIVYAVIYPSEFAQVVAHSSSAPPVHWAVSLAAGIALFWILERIKAYLRQNMTAIATSPSINAKHLPHELEDLVSSTVDAPPGVTLAVEPSHPASEVQTVEQTELGRCLTKRASTAFEREHHNRRAMLSVPWYLIVSSLPSSVENAWQRWSETATADQASGLNPQDIYNGALEAIATVDPFSNLDQGVYRQQAKTVHPDATIEDLSVQVGQWLEAAAINAFNLPEGRVRNELSNLAAQLDDVRGRAVNSVIRFFFVETWLSWVRGVVSADGDADPGPKFLGTYIVLTAFLAYLHSFDHVYLSNKA